MRLFQCVELGDCEIANLTHGVRAKVIYAETKWVLEKESGWWRDLMSFLVSDTRRKPSGQ